MRLLEKSAWALLLIVLWLVLCASIIRLADAKPALITLSEPDHADL